ncbi:GtrA family protein [Salinibacterium sp. G-O1]|uniref:GtrA family protein n=1 Tax=Salinibacterium sp. G-O1 TaxID=3046208 RepID=UPI0024BB650B|nr:GtrA family protein [Salinibacterium sp. G-O1]MDJ0336502.1 GtrA family protein [Salinibacterium sp. G-O1]
MRRFITQLARFGLVGLVGLVIDVGVFNLLRATVLEPSVLHEGPFLAKVISTTLAIAANYVGNRYWTFAATKRSAVVREGLEFLAVSIGGMLIALSCLWISHYVLGFTSLLADNISSNVVGLALGTAFRFTFYRYWVFHPNRQRPLRPAVESALEPEAATTQPRKAASPQ